MVDVWGRRARLWTGYVAWVVAASCGYEPLPGVPDDESPPVSSCAGLGKICGPAGNADCCQAATVFGGMFYRGHDVADDNAFPDKGCPATVSRFALDTYEVTVGRFRAFVEAGEGTQYNPPETGSGAHPELPGSGWDSAWDTSLAADTEALTFAVKCEASLQTWTDMPGANENKPINCVSWYEAMAFCIWDCGYLPTEAEWNYAASGGDQQRAYPWSMPESSTMVDCAHANFGGCGKGITRVGGQSPAGDGKWGHSDLVGNVWEWTLDWYDSQCPLPCKDCANLTPAIRRVIRGGSLFDHDQVEFLRPAARNGFVPPANRGPNVGFRCARTP